MRFFGLEKIGKRFNDSPVGLAFQGRRGDIDMEGAQEVFFNTRFFGVGVGDDGNFHRIGLMG